MASPRFDANIITAAIRLHDPRTAAHSDTNESKMRYSETALVAYQNRAIKDLIKDVYLAHVHDFHLVMPEMLKESDALTITNNVATRPTDCWVILECVDSAFAVWYGHRIVGDVAKIRAGRDALIVPSTSKPWFYESGSSIVFLSGSSSLTGSAKVTYIPLVSDMTAGNSTDIPIANVWDAEIVRRMVQMGLEDAKSAIAV